MTAKEFADRMAEASIGHDLELVHIAMDNLLCEYIRALATKHQEDTTEVERALNTYLDTEVWYA